MSKLSMHRTTIHTTKEGYTTVVYHSTPIVSYNSHEITLNTGGFWTATTKKKMNQVSDMFNLGYKVYQKKGQWFVTWLDVDVPFAADSITLVRTQ
jgi:hypothetical protein